MVSKPRCARELDGVGDLVDGHPQNQLVAIHGEVACRECQVGSEQQQPWRYAVVEQRQVVLAQHPLGEHAGQRADLGTQQEPRGRAQGPGERAGGWRLDVVGERLHERSHALQVGGDPARPVDHLERRQLARQLQPAVGAHALGEVVRERLDRAGAHASIGR
jgi:hypothetical protein